MFNNNNSNNTGSHCSRACRPRVRQGPLEFRSPDHSLTLSCHRWVCAPKKVDFTVVFMLEMGLFRSDGATIGGHRGAVEHAGCVVAWRSPPPCKWLRAPETGHQTAGAVSRDRPGGADLSPSCRALQGACWPLTPTPTGPSCRTVGSWIASGRAS